MREIGIRICVTILAAVCSASLMSGQEVREGAVEFDRTVCDFGDVLLSDGPLKCSFNVKNISDKPLVIYNVTTSCGCTDAQWTREPVQPGKSGVITATYTNDEGPYPFDKTLTVHISSLKKPVVLRLRGYSHDKKKSLSETYPVHIGNFGFREAEIKCGNLDMGESKSTAVKVANLSGSPQRLSFSGVTPGLALQVSPNPIPASGVATLTCTVTSQDGVWGRNCYTADIVGTAGGKVTVSGFTKENFDNLTKEQKDAGSRPMFKESTYSFGKVRKGTKVRASWEFSNVGKSVFIAHKADADKPGCKVSQIPQVPSGGKGSFTAELDTAQLPEGEVLVIVTLTTNSPLRPIVNLFIAGWIE
ncbi:MAG: DUF1573 domain-containing protein [Candidatus Cryptobacteroides sp.]